MKRSMALFAAGALSLSGWATQAQADEVTEQIELGLELYQEEEYGAAITELEFAISDIRKLMSARIAETFPDPPEGWNAAEVSTSGGGGAAMFGGRGSMLEREYRQEGGEGRLTAQLMIDNPMIQAMSAMFSNPALIAAQPDMERIRIGRESAILKWDADNGSAEASFLMDGRILMQVNGSGLASEKPAVSLLKAWDLDAVREHSAR
ncbi:MULTISPECIES: hypothetical protein [unclassified Halomonas]|uniref:hypothetical protein n=1 Tax=unclassified Halomonas TaxID=2609666 RepID=UPI00288546A2|nr:MULTISPECIES: hypothetical protein [unclassified Halomonas]MDT0500594.1 hypothetical protein [Halomonas sp. PAR7]MDT0511510.1 hypothetical protein [Halomonas sp. LES1]MDT0590202.1 hypothetical protein [Halomonas sp. PAR8]